MKMYGRRGMVRKRGSALSRRTISQKSSLPIRSSISRIQSQCDPIGILCRCSISAVIARSLSHQSSIFERTARALFPGGARNTRYTSSGAQYQTNVTYIFGIGEQGCDICHSGDSRPAEVIYRRGRKGAEIRGIRTALTEAVVAAGGQVLRRVGVMRTASPFAGPERLDFRSQGQTAPEELLVGNAAVLVRAQFPHQFLHRVLEVQFPAHRQ